jgi:ferredoxin-NADP reductase
VQLHLRRVEGGRFTSWAFSTMKVGDVALELDRAGVPKDRVHTDSFGV